MMSLALTPDEKLIVVLERKSWELPSALDPLLKLRFDKRRSRPPTSMRGSRPGSGHPKMPSSVVNSRRRIRAC